MESRAASPRTLNSLKDGSVSDFTRQDAKSAFCHFDRREKSFLDPSQRARDDGPRPVTWRALSPFEVAQDMLCVSHAGLYVVFVTVNLEPVMGGL